MTKTKGFLLTAGLALAMAFTFSCSEINGEDDISSSSREGDGSSSSVGGNGSSSSGGDPVSSSSGDGRPWCVWHDGERCTNDPDYVSDDTCYEWGDELKEECPAGYDKDDYYKLSCGLSLEYQFSAWYDYCKENWEGEYESQEECQDKIVEPYCDGKSYEACYQDYQTTCSGDIFEGWCVDHNLGICSNNPDLLNYDACYDWDGELEEECPDGYTPYYYED